MSLLLPLGARVVSLGQALTTRPSVEGVFFNPASLAGHGKHEFVVHTAKTLDGRNFAFTLVVDAGVAGSFGLTVVLIDLGKAEATDDLGRPIGEVAIGSQHLHGSYAIQILPGLRAGISGKLYNAYSGSVSASTGLIDFGVQYAPRRIPALELGASIVHLGLDLQVVNAQQADPTPARARIGAAYELGHHFLADSSIAVWLALDAVSSVRNIWSVTPDTTGSAGDTDRSLRAPLINLGLELSFDQTIFLRAGYAAAGDNPAAGGGGIGIGIRYDRYTVGIAKSFNRSELQPEGEPFQISFEIAF